MSISQKYFLLFTISAFMAAPFLCSAATYNPEKIFYMSQLKEKEGIASLKKNSDKIDILAPQFYGVSAKMQLTGRLDANLTSVINQNNIKVMPLVTNSGFKQDIIHNLLLSSTAQNAIIKGLVYIAQKDNYIGWQFDFENINYLDRDLYSAFVEKSAQSLHKNGLALSVAAVSRSVDFEDTDAFENWSGVFDYARIAKAVDFVSLMAYDDPDSTGPVASLPFTQKVLDYAKDKIPPEKLSFGIPLYNWGWSTDPFKKITASGTYDGLLYIRSNFRHDLGFNDALGAAWLTYFWQNKQYQVWYQDKQTFENKLDIIKQNNFRGFSAWVLGVEDPGIWSVLDKTKGH
jgi:spore germination protein YaaH